MGDKERRSQRQRILKNTFAQIYIPEEKQNDKAHRLRQRKSQGA
jgi:hypothetical protein